MGKALRLLFLVLFATALVWAAVILHWQYTERPVQADDLVLYLLVLPLLVVGGALALRWAWRRAAQEQAAAAVPAAAPAGAAAPVAAPERQLVMRVLGVGVAAPQADQADALLDRLAEPPPVQLDPWLRDLDGMGLFTRRCEGLPDDRHERALALAKRCVEPVLQRLSGLAQEEAARHTLPEAPAPAHPTLVTPRRPAAPKLQVRVLWALNETLDEPARAAVRQQADAIVRGWAEALPGTEFHLEAVAVRSGVALLLQAERRLLLAHREGRAEHLLVIAAESCLDEALVDRLDAAGELFTSQRPAGLMPGEAAAALLLAPPAEGAAAVESVGLHRLSAQRRDKSADAPGRVTGTHLTEALRQLLEAAQLPAEQIALAFTDTDLRSSRSGELFEALQAAAPPLASAELARCAGVATGAVGLVAAPLALALAAAHAHRRREAALAISHADPFDRLAAVLSPPATSA